MNPVLLEAATNIDIPSVREWKENNGKVVGYTCSFMPVELFYAAGILPVRLRGIHATGLEIADSYYGPFVCSFPKALLQIAGTKKYDFLDGVVISNGCDTLRRLDDCWRKMGEDIEGTAPDWFYFVDVPHKPDGHALEWYESQLKKLISAIEAHFQVEITEEKLVSAIKKQNKIRKLLWKLEDARRQKKVTITGSEAYTAIVAGTVMPRDLYEKHLADLLADIDSREDDVAKGRKKLFLGGSICDDFDLIQLIEESEALVVGENVCFGIRNENDIVEEDEEPILALAKKYLSASVCPRMMGWYRERAALITDRIQRVHAEGVILQNIRFCDLHGSENGLLERDLEKINMPALRIEREYGPLTEAGRLKMRVDAFVEQLS